MRKAAAILVLVTSGGCGGSSGPTAPSPPEPSFGPTLGSGGGVQSNPSTGGGGVGAPPSGGAGNATVGQGGAGTTSVNGSPTQGGTTTGTAGAPGCGVTAATMSGMATMAAMSSSPSCSDFGSCVGNAIEGSCQSSYAACLGPDYMSGNYSGPCAPFVQCVEACGCSDQHCVAGCTMPAQDCAACLSSAEMCLLNACQGPYSSCVNMDLGDAGGGAGTSGGSGGSTHTCQDLSQCCSKLSNSSEQSACNQGASAGIDATCNAIYSGLGCGM